MVGFVMWYDETSWSEVRQTQPGRRQKRSPLTLESDAAWAIPRRGQKDSLSEKLLGSCWWDTQVEGQGVIREREETELGLK